MLRTMKLTFFSVPVTVAAAVVMSIAAVSSKNFVAAGFAWMAAYWCAVAYITSKKLPPDKP